MGWEVVKRGSVVVALRAELAVIEGDQQSIETDGRSPRTGEKRKMEIN